MSILRSADTTLFHERSCRYAAVFVLLCLPFAGRALADELRPGADIQDCADCPKMIVIPAGSFQMGSTVEETDREKMPAVYAAMEKPRHAVTIPKPFAIGKYEITKAEYAAFVAATKRADAFYCRIYDDKGVYFDTVPGKDWKDPGFKQTDREPVVCISWDDALAYTQWLSARTGKRYRLPSEAEWEYAARGGTSTARWWGELILGACQNANVGDQSAGGGKYLWGKAGAPVTYDLQGGDRLAKCDDGYPFTSPVGSFKPNPFGVYDMLGNAWEWVADCLHEGYAGAPTDGSAWDAPSEKCLSGFRINRGASWAHFPWGIRAALRNANPADGRFYTQGMRIARDLD
jgi:formylglycine-generating enzyme required for sulfatase activity